MVCCYERMELHEPRSTFQDQEALEGHEAYIIPEPEFWLVLKSINKNISALNIKLNQNQCCLTWFSLPDVLLRIWTAFVISGSSTSANQTGGVDG